MAFDNISISLDCYLTSEFTLSLALAPNPDNPGPRYPSHLPRGTLLSLP